MLLDEIVKLLESELGISGISFLLMSIVGYVGYSVAYSGLKIKDKFFKIAIFSLPFLILILGWKQPLVTHSIIIQSNLFTISVASVIISFLMGIIWRKWLRKKVSNLLILFKITTSDGYDTIYDEINTRTDIEVRTITVGLKNGKKYVAHPSGEKENVRNISDGCIDKDGNIGIFVREVILSDGTEIKINPDNQKKHTVTCIPKDSIEFIDYLYSK